MGLEAPEGKHRTKASRGTCKFTGDGCCMTKSVHSYGAIRKRTMLFVDASAPCDSSAFTTSRLLSAKAYWIAVSPCPTHTSHDISCGCFAQLHMSCARAYNMLGCLAYIDHTLDQKLPSKLNHSVILDLMIPFLRAFVAGREANRGGKRGGAEGGGGLRGALHERCVATLLQEPCEAWRCPHWCYFADLFISV